MGWSTLITYFQTNRIQLLYQINKGSIGFKKLRTELNINKYARSQISVHVYRTLILETHTHTLLAIHLKYPVFYFHHIHCYTLRKTLIPFLIYEK